MKSMILIVVWLMGSGLIPAKATTSSQADRMTAAQMAAAELEYAQWFNQLNEHLLQSEDSHEVALGLAAMLSSSLQAINRTDASSDQSTGEQNQQNLALQINLLNQLIKRDDLSNSTLELLRNWCFKAAIFQACDHDTLLDKQLKQDPKNLLVYMQPLALSVSQKNNQLTDHIINLMAVSQSSQATLFISEAFNEKLDQYLNTHPHT